MAESEQEALNKITAQIERQRGAYSDWYCGITSNIEDRLFYDHNVPKKDHWRAQSKCESSEVARAVEKALLDLDCDGGSGGGDEDSIYVYAYLKSSETNQ